MKQPATAAVLLASIALACTANQTSGAAQGAAHGLVGGAAAGAVTALIFGGDVAESAARGATWAGTMGAVGGAMAGSQADRNQAAIRRAEAQQNLVDLRRRIGDDAFNGLGALARCKHEVALAYAKSARATDNTNFALAGVWLEALTYLDLGRDAEAEALYPTLVSEDEHTRSVEQANAQARDVLEVVRDYRVEDGLPRVCP